jgi:hypothetical protein
MRSRDWNTLGYIGLIIGVILLAGGYFEYARAALTYITLDELYMILLSTQLFGE